MEDKDKIQAEHGQKIKQVIDNWIEGWNEKNLDKIMESYADTAELYDPKIKEFYTDTFVLTGKENIRNYFSIIMKLFPELQIKPLGLWLKGYDAILEYYIYTTPETKVDVVSKFYINKYYKIQGQFMYYGLSYKEIKEEGKKE
ncbi:MAG: nuclear transport factor 2 family protein [Aquificae bacterium]|nr:nuclear transport factor 2 family protein [Aquificota bacterium]